MCLGSFSSFFFSSDRYPINRNQIPIVHLKSSARKLQKQSLDSRQLTFHQTEFQSAHAVTWVVVQVRRSVNLSVPDSAISLKSVVARLDKLKYKPLPYSGCSCTALRFKVSLSPAKALIFAAASHSQTSILIRDPAQ